MRGRQLLFRATFLGIAALPTAGCMRPMVARYVYQDHDFGVVAIPMNTYLGKMSFRDEAEALMARHFPDGYEIVRAEEVNEGERTLDVGRKTQFETEPNFTALNQMIKLGKLDQTTSFEQKDKIMVRECRIIYKRKTAASPVTMGQFASTSSINPRFYIDPNETVRRQNAEMIAKNAEAIAKNTATTKKTDSEVIKATQQDGAATPLRRPRRRTAQASANAVTITVQPVAITSPPDRMTSPPCARRELLRCACSNDVQSMFSRGT